MAKKVITYEGKHTLKNVQKEFKEHLSKDKITEITAQSINKTAEDSFPKVKEAIKKEYTIQDKYLSRMKQHLSKRASNNSLYADVSYISNPLKMRMFDYKTSGNRGNITVEIKRGSSIFMEHMISRAVTQNKFTGIFSSGKYKKGGFKRETSYTKKVRYTRKKTGYGPGNRGKGTKQFKTYMTDMLSVSPYSAILNDARPHVEKHITDAMPKDLREALQKEIDKMGK